MTQTVSIDRPELTMPEEEAARLRAAYEARPPYQRNDYLGWISRAKQDDTKQRRLAQMLDELELTHAASWFDAGRLAHQQSMPVQSQCFSERVELFPLRGSDRIQKLHRPGTQVIHEHGAFVIAASRSTDRTQRTFDVYAIPELPTAPRRR